jgi:hypothetical protein
MSEEKNNLNNFVLPLPKTLHRRHRDFQSPQIATLAMRTVTLR